VDGDSSGDKHYGDSVGWISPVLANGVFCWLDYLRQSSWRVSVEKESGGCLLSESVRSQRRSHGA
jgi:hypothetical protein